MKNKLSKAQANVIVALVENKDAYLIKSDLYHWSKVWCNDKPIILSIYRPTVECLIKKNFLVTTEKKNIFKLNSEIKFENFQSHP